jgi:hypothetical protein
MSKQLLTHSCRQAFLNCPRSYYWSYVRRLRKINDPKALRMGSAGHLGTETLHKGGALDDACQAVRDYYDGIEPFDQYEHDLECATILNLIAGYQWRWQDHRLTYIAVEQQYSIPLINPKSKRKSRQWDWGGKIDGIIAYEDARQAVLETKFLGDDIGPESKLWSRLRIDPQISSYVVAARRLGFNVESVLYNVIRKPTIKPSPIPVLDELGAKIVLDQYGLRVLTERGQWRQTGDKEKGYVLQTRPCTPEEWGERLLEDITSRPDFYFARKEIARLQADLDDFEYEMFGVGQLIKDAEKGGRWIKNVSKNTCQYCSYFNLCATSAEVDDRHPPDGFVVLGTAHPELAEPEVPAEQEESYW